MYLVSSLSVCVFCVHLCKHPHCQMTAANIEITQLLIPVSVPGMKSLKSPTLGWSLVPTSGRMHTTNTLLINSSHNVASAIVRLKSNREEHIISNLWAYLHAWAEGEDWNKYTHKCAVVQMQPPRISPSSQSIFGCSRCQPVPSQLPVNSQPLGVFPPPSVRSTNKLGGMIKDTCSCLCWELRGM